jgi:hypothetical protein
MNTREVIVSGDSRSVRSLAHRQKAVRAIEHKAWLMAYVTPQNPSLLPGLSGDMLQFLNPKNP